MTSFVGRSNRIHKLASGHYLLLRVDAPYAIVPLDMNVSSYEVDAQIKRFRELADELEAASKRLDESASAALENERSVCEAAAPFDSHLHCEWLEGHEGPHSWNKRYGP